MTISERTQGLVARVPDHPFAPTVKAAMAEMIGAAESFATKKSELIRAGKLTPLGLKDALRDNLSETMKSLVRARKPVEQAQSEIKKRRTALTRKEADPTNVVAALDRQERRAWLRSLNDAQRQSILLTTSDDRLVEAAVTAPMGLSGFSGDIMARVFAEVEERYIEMQHGPEVAAIAELAAVVAEGDAAAQIARNMVQQETGMDDREFTRIVEPIDRRASAPWLLKTSGSSTSPERIMVVNLTAEGHATYREATKADLIDGVYYENADAYRQAQAAGAQAAA
jgi:hypothetical protein